MMENWITLAFGGYRVAKRAPSTMIWRALIMPQRYCKAVASRMLTTRLPAMIDCTDAEKVSTSAITVSTLA